MVDKKDPLEKAEEDLERIIEASNRTIRRAERSIKNIKKVKVNGVYPQVEKLSLTGMVDFEVMGKLAARYLPRKRVPGVISRIKILLGAAQINTNEDFVAGYQNLIVCDKNKLGEAEDKVCLAYFKCIDY